MQRVNTHNLQINGIWTYKQKTVINMIIQRLVTHTHTYTHTHARTHARTHTHTGLICCNRATDGVVSPRLLQTLSVHLHTPVWRGLWTRNEGRVSAGVDEVLDTSDITRQWRGRPLPWYDSGVRYGQSVGRLARVVCKNGTNESTSSWEW